VCVVEGVIDMKVETEETGNQMCSVNGFVVCEFQSDDYSTVEKLLWRIKTNIHTHIETFRCYA